MEMTKQEIIEETVEYYRNNPFGFDPTKYQGEGGCVYYGTEEQMCAVGRCLIDPTRFAANSDSAFVLFEEHSQAILKEQYLGHQFNFWMDLQEFHDNCANGLFQLEDYKNHKHLKKYYA